jgi:hypothetical protein
VANTLAYYSNNYDRKKFYDSGHNICSVFQIEILRVALLVLNPIHRPQGGSKLTWLQTDGALDGVGAAIGAPCVGGALLEQLPDESPLFLFQLGDDLTLPVNFVGQHPILILKPQNSSLVALVRLVLALDAGSNLGRISIGAFHEIGEMLVQLSDVTKLEDATLLFKKRRKNCLYRFSVR